MRSASSAMRTQPAAPYPTLREREATPPQPSPSQGEGAALTPVTTRRCASASPTLRERGATSPPTALLRKERGESSPLPPYEGESQQLAPPPYEGGGRGEVL